MSVCLSVCTSYLQASVRRPPRLLPPLHPARATAPSNSGSSAILQRAPRRQRSSPQRTSIMADQQAGRRIQAIGQQLQPSPSGLPPIQRVAAGSSAPRAQGKVVIITGKDATPPPPFSHIPCATRVFFATRLLHEILTDLTHEKAPTRPWASGAPRPTSSLRAAPGRCTCVTTTARTSSLTRATSRPPFRASRSMRAASMPLTRPRSRPSLTTP